MQECLFDTAREVQRLRSRERRVVRVFWRVRCKGKPMGDYTVRNNALWEAGLCSVCVVYRVVVRRVAKAGRE